MSTLKKIIPTTKNIAKGSSPRHRRPSKAPHVRSVGSLPDKEKVDLERKLRFQLKETDRARNDANHWTSLYHKEHDRLQKSEGLLSLCRAEVVELKAQLAKKDAQVRDLQKKLFGESSEKGSSKPTNKPPEVGETVKNKRGKQTGTKGYGRKSHEGLPIGDEVEHNVEPGAEVCPDCGESGSPVGFEESCEVEVEVKAYKRKHRRQKVGHFCKSKSKWVTKTAPVPAKLTPKGGYGISFWVFCLLGKFVFHTPLNRLCAQMAMQGLPVSAGTIVGGFKRISVLIAPLIEEIKRYSREQKHHWHIDDTGWKVFVHFDGKTNHNWFLWVFLSNDVCVFILNPSRGRAVPQSHLEHSIGVVTSDRLAANKKLGDNIRHSFCWVHERRELRELAAGYPEIADTCNAFLELIASLYFLNAKRLLSEPGSQSRCDADQALRDNMQKIRTSCDTHLAQPKLHSELKRVLSGMVKDWDGLTVFMDLPNIPPDNNPAERAIRGPVVGKKNYSGSSSEWSGHLSADMFTLNETLKLNGVNTSEFLTEYLRVCALNGGHAPPNAKNYLPWNRQLLS